MDEHTALIDQSYGVRQALRADDASAAMTLLTALVLRLERHVHREEDGIFRALRSSGEYLEEVDALKGEHVDLVKAIRDLDPQTPDFPNAVTRLLDDLAVHIDREDYGIFPVSVVTFGSGRLVDRRPGPLDDTELPARLDDTPRPGRS